MRKNRISRKVFGYRAIQVYLDSEIICLPQ